MGCLKLEDNFLKVVSGKNASGNQEFTVYVNPYLVTTHKGDYTKHYYIGSERILSKPGDNSTYDNEDPRRTAKAGFTVDETDMPNYVELLTQANQREIAKHDSLGMPFVAPKTNTETFTQNGRLPENQLYFYHPDHLGSSSYISYTDGEIAEHIEYVPFGEVLLDETNRSWNTPWLFNGKELDEETGYYYYGSRYYNPKISNWLSVDPIALYDPINETEHYIDGEHNGGYYNPKNMSVYGYTYQNPIVYVDPNGKQSVFHVLLGAAVLTAGPDYVIAKLGENRCTNGCDGWLNTEFIGPTTEASKLIKTNKPVDEVDLAAFSHDLSYEKSGAEGIEGAFVDNDPVTLAADKKLVSDAQKVLDKFKNGEKDSRTGNPVTHATAARGRLILKAFKPLIAQKEARLKIQEMRNENVEKSKNMTVEKKGGSVDEIMGNNRIKLSSERRE